MIPLLYNDDCFNVFPQLEDKSIDLVLCDVPYGTTACKWDTVIDLERMWVELRRIVKPNTAIVLTASQPFTAILGVSNIKELQYQWTWIKSRATGHLNAKKRPMKSTEDILVFYKNQPTYNPQGLLYKPVQAQNSKSHSLRDKNNRTSTVSGGVKYTKYIQEYTNYPRQHLEIPSESLTVHPTQKPVALMEYLIKTYSNEDDTVLDFCMGSGTTGVACKNLNRAFIGIEKEEGYYNTAKERVENII